MLNQDARSHDLRRQSDPDFQASIRASWQRCESQYGLNPKQISKPNVLTRAELLDQTSPIEEFVALASPEVRRLFDRMNGAGYLTSLATSSGAIIFNRGEHDLNGVTKSIGLLPGSIWSEQDKGTNGVGTCIHTQRAISVISREHFDDSLKAMTCTVAPVFGPNGQMQCLISTATDRPTDDSTQRLLRGALIHSANRIENAYFAHFHRGARILRLANEIDFIDTASEVRLAIDDNDIILDATSNLGELLVVGREEVVGRSFYEIFAADRQLDSYTSPKALGPGLGRNARIYAQSQASQNKVALVTADHSPARESTTGQTPESSQVFADHPVLVDRIPAAIRLARAGVPVLLAGEAGVGKEKIARMIFEQTNYARFTVIRCKSGGDKELSKVLADPDFEGVLYLEDIECLLAQSQHELSLMLLRNGATNYGLGAEGFLPTTVVASTMTVGSHWNESSSLDQQLFNAFGGTTISVPPIRDYPNIDIVIQKTFEQAFRIHNRSELSLSVQAKEVLRNHLWVGNISEIEGVARHCCAVCAGPVVNVTDLPAIFQQNPGNHEDCSMLNGHSGISQSTLQSALTHNNWNASKTARFLGISRATLYRKMNEAGIERPDK